MSKMTAENFIALIVGEEQVHRGGAKDAERRRCGDGRWKIEDRGWRKALNSPGLGGDAKITKGQGLQRKEALHHARTT
jgi:hypothetical protein